MDESLEMLLLLAAIIGQANMAAAMSLCFGRTEGSLLSAVIGVMQPVADASAVNGGAGAGLDHGFPTVASLGDHAASPSGPDVAAQFAQLDVTLANVRCHHSLIRRQRS